MYVISLSHSPDWNIFFYQVISLFSPWIKVTHDGLRRAEKVRGSESAARSVADGDRGMVAM